MCYREGVPRALGYWSLLETAIECDSLCSCDLHRREAFESLLGFTSVWESLGESFGSCDCRLGRAFKSRRGHRLQRASDCRDRISVTSESLPRQSANRGYRDARGQAVVRAT